MHTPRLPRPRSATVATSLAVAWLLAATAAHAQVLQCTDRDGHITFTNAPCPAGQRVQQVAPAISPQAQAHQDALYQEALQRRRAEQALQAERDAVQARIDAARASERAAQRGARHLPAPAPVIVEVPSAAPPYYPPPSAQWRPPPPYPAPPPAQPARSEHNCNAIRCYDGKGNTWPRP